MCRGTYLWMTYMWRNTIFSKAWLQLNLKFVIYDAASLWFLFSWKTLSNLSFSTNSSRNTIFFSATANVVFKKTPGLAHS